jgi:hypothetical protein
MTGALIAMLLGVILCAVAGGASGAVAASLVLLVGLGVIKLVMWRQAL